MPAFYTLLNLICYVTLFSDTHQTEPQYDFIVTLMILFVIEL